MSQTFNPRPYQTNIINHIKEHPRSLIFADMGLGKTVSVLTALKEADMFPVLVLAPLRVVQSTWMEEVKKWGHLNDINIKAAVGTPVQRKAALKKGTQIVAMNYENIEWLVALSKDKKWPFKTIVADESTRLKGFRTRQGTKRARALGKVAFASKYFIGLTGTPAPNGIQDLWGQAWFVDKGERLGRSFSAFTNRWFCRGWDGFSLEAMPHSQREVQEKLSDVCISIRAKDWLTTDEPNFIRVPIILPPKARALYKEMERELFMQIEEHGVAAANAAVKAQKCLQIAAGAVYVEEGKSWQLIHDAKIDALRSVIEEAAGMPVLVAYQYRSDEERLCKAFPQGKVLGKDPNIIKKWNEGKIPILFAHPASCGHGLNLQDGSNRLCFFNHSWNLEHHLQIIERIGPARQKQSGYDRPVFVYSIVAENTLEEDVMDRLTSKKSVQDVLMAALRRIGKG